MLYQLSKDIKAMRGSVDGSGKFNASTFNGTIMFPSNSVGDLSNLYNATNNPKSSEKACVDAINKVIGIVRSRYKRWEGYLSVTPIRFLNKDIGSDDLIQMLFEMQNKLPSNPSDASGSRDGNQNLENVIVYTISVIEAIQDVDGVTKGVRQKLFESYVGSEFTIGFSQYFNDMFGTANDVEITIEMLNDASLIEGYFNNISAMVFSKSPADKIRYSQELIKKFGEVWGSKLPADNYAAFLNGVINLFGGIKDQVIEFLGGLGIEHDEFFINAENMGNDYIISVLNVFPSAPSNDEIEAIRASISSGPVTAKKKKTRLLV
jgi:hypothetical protein